MTEFVRLSDAGDAFVVSHAGETFIVPFARLMEVMAVADSISFSGAFYAEGWGWRLAFDGLDLEVVEQAAHFTKTHFVRPWVGREVDYDELIADPDAYDGMLVHVTGPWRVDRDGVWLGEVRMRAPELGAAREEGASLRKVTGFWFSDHRVPRLELVAIRPSLSEPHRRCSAGPTRVLVASGDVLRTDGPLPAPDLLPSEGRGMYEGLNFEHPLSQWFEEFRSITVFTWASWLMSDDELSTYAAWEFTGPDDWFGVREDWGFLQLSFPVVHPGVLRSSAHAVGALCDWSPTDAERVVYTEADVVLEPGSTGRQRGDLVGGAEADEIWKDESAKLAIGAEAVRDILRDPPFGDGSVDPGQTRLVRSAFDAPHNKARHIVISRFPIPPSQLRTPEAELALEELWDASERMRHILRIPRAPAPVKRAIVVRMQEHANAAYEAIVRALA